MILDKRRVPTVRHADKSGLGLGSASGGLLELGERLEEAARGDALEEIGLSVNIERLIDASDDMIHDDDERVEFHCVPVEYLASPLRGELQASRESMEARWIDLSEVRALKTTTTALRTLGESGPPSLERGVEGEEAACRAVHHRDRSETAISAVSDCANRSLLVSASLSEALAKISAAEGKAKELLSKADLEAKEKVRRAEIEARRVYHEAYEAHLGQARAGAAQVKEAREAAKAKAEEALKEAERQIAALRRQAEGRFEGTAQALAEEILSAAWGRA